MDGSNNKETSAFTSICPKKSDEISAASHESSATTNTPTTTTSNGKISTYINDWVLLT